MGVEAPLSAAIVAFSTQAASNIDPSLGSTLLAQFVGLCPENGYHAGLVPSAWSDPLAQFAGVSLEDGCHNSR